MNLTFEQISACVFGVDRTEECEGLLVLHRFTEAQEQMYLETNWNHYVRSRATANVTLEFETDSPFLELDVSLISGSATGIFTHSIFVNGLRLGELSGKMEEDATEFSGRVELGEGEKQVKIYFPWSVGSRIRALKLEDGAAFRPVSKSGKKMLLFGDSITQGYKALRPEHTYAVRLAEHLGLEGINKGIGGEVFRPALAELPDPLTPELITVAYGTNDWSKTDAQTLQTNSRAFYRALRKNYPLTKIVVMAPTWRASWESVKPAGPFRDVAKLLQEIAGEIGNAEFIDCFDFLPKDLRVMADNVHPMDEGFRYYFEGLSKIL